MKASRGLNEDVTAVQHEKALGLRASPRAEGFARIMETPLVRGDRGLSNPLSQKTSTLAVFIQEPFMKLKLCAAALAADTGKRL